MKGGAAGGRGSGMGGRGETARWEQGRESVFYPKSSKQPSSFKQRDEVIRSGRKTPSGNRGERRVERL